MPPKKSSQGRGRGRPNTRSQPGQEPPINDNEESNIADLIAQQISAAIPAIAAAVHAIGPQQGTSSGGAPHTGPVIGEDDDQNDEYAAKGCTYKMFMGCKPKNLNGTEGAIGTLQWLDHVESVLEISDCKEAEMVRFASHLFQKGAEQWWKSVLKPRGRYADRKMNWDEFKDLVIEKYCPPNEIEKLETEFLALRMNGVDQVEYTNRFEELARLVPHLASPETKKVSRYIWGLNPKIRGMVKSSRPATFQSAVEIAASLTDDLARVDEPRRNETMENKRLRDDRDITDKEIERKRKVYMGTNPYCAKCNRHHQGECRRERVCFKCQKPGHLRNDCPEKNSRCSECGDYRHLQNACPTLEKGKNGRAQGRVFQLDNVTARKDPEDVTGTFPPNNYYAFVLSDMSATSSLVPTNFQSIK